MISKVTITPDSIDTMVIISFIIIDTVDTKETMVTLYNPSMYITQLDREDLSEWNIKELCKDRLRGENVGKDRWNEGNIGDGEDILGESEISYDTLEGGEEVGQDIQEWGVGCQVFRMCIRNWRSGMGNLQTYFSSDT